MNALKVMAFLGFSLGLALTLPLATADFDDSYAPTPLTQITVDPPESRHFVVGDYSKDKELVKCVENITRLCGDEIFLFVFMGETYPSPNCCDKLVNTGRRCHGLMIERIAKSFPEFHDKIVSDPKNEELWRYCLMKTAASSPSN